MLDSAGKGQIENILRKRTSNDMSPLAIKYLKFLKRAMKRETKLQRKELQLNNSDVPHLTELAV